MTRLRDQAALLEPATTADPLTGDPHPDWNRDPVEHPTRFQGHPLDSTEAQLTDDTIVARWRGFLPAKWAGVVDSTWRVRWHGEDYTIDGDVDVHRHASQPRHLSVTLQKISGATVTS